MEPKISNVGRGGANFGRGGANVGGRGAAEAKSLKSQRKSSRATAAGVKRAWPSFSAGWDSN